MIICVSEKHIYIRAGGHRLSIKAIYIICGKKDIYNINLGFHINDYCKYDCDNGPCTYIKCIVA
jgi:hypothetical protein